MLKDGEQSPEFARERAALDRKRILLAVEDPQVRARATQILTKLGAFVYAVGDGVEAAEQLPKQVRKKELIEFAVIDATLPRMNGVAFLRYIRDNQYFHALPVIILSSGSETDERYLHECRCLGIDNHVPKPLDMNQLVATLVRSINSRAENLIDERPLLEPEEPNFTQLGYPLEFGGFPMPKSYPLRASYYRCPFCTTTFTAPRLCNRALKPADNDRLAIGLFTEGLEKDFVEFPLIDAIVCPSCLYASDRIGFFRIWTRGEGSLKEMRAIPTKQWEPVYFQVVPRIRSYMADGLDKRQEIASRAGDEGRALFTLAHGDDSIPRAPSDALIALELAALCAQTLSKAYRGEPKARLRHKLASYRLKQFYVVRLLAGKNKPDPETANRIRQKRIRLMYDAMQALMTVNDIDFNVLEERLHCLTRRFFLADMLLPHLPNKEEAVQLAQIRKICFNNMKQLLIRARQAKSTELRIIERFLLPLENRMYEIKKKEETLRASQQTPQQR